MAFDLGFLAGIVEIIRNLSTTFRELVLGMFPGQEFMVAIAISAVLSWLIVRSRITNMMLGVLIFLMFLIFFIT